MRTCSSMPRETHRFRSRANARRALSRNRVSRPHSSYGELAGAGTSETTRSFSTRYVSAGGGNGVTPSFMRLDTRVDVRGGRAAASAWEERPRGRRALLLMPPSESAGDRWSGCSRAAPCRPQRASSAPPRSRLLSWECGTFGAPSSAREPCRSLARWGRRVPVISLSARRCRSPTTAAPRSDASTSAPGWSTRSRFTS
jgi:hypothetical protein